MVYRHPARFRLAVSGRRWGKSRLGLAEILRAALHGNPPYDPASPPMVVVGMPTLKQCKKIFWKPLLNLLTKHPWVESINKSDFTISFHNPEPDKYYRPDIVCVGLNDSDGDRVRGLRIFFFLGDEIQDVKHNVLDDVILPAMADTPGSRALLSGTPKGKVNHTYKLDLAAAERYQPDDVDNDQIVKVVRPEGKAAWAAFNFFTTHNPHVRREEIAELEATLPPRVFRQEVKASYEDFPGKIYDHFEDRCQVDAAPRQFVNVLLGIDWGDLHPALVVIGRDNRDLYWVVDCWYNTTENPVLDGDLFGKAVSLCRQWGVTHAFADPSRPAVIEDWKKEGALRHVTALASLQEGFNPISEGNNLINGLYYHGRLFVLKTLGHLIDTEQSYHRRQDKNGLILDEVAPAQDDHLQDAKRYALATYERKFKNAQAAPLPTPQAGIRDIVGTVRQPGTITRIK